MLLNDKKREFWNFLYNDIDFEVSTHGKIRNTQTLKLQNQYKDKDGYNIIRLKKKTYFVHRLLAFAWIPNPEPLTNKIIDHIDGNKTNNHISNLRWVNRFQNMWNRKVNKNSKSGLKGAFYIEKKKKYISYIKCNNERIYLGVFKTAEEAHEVYKKKAIELHGKYSPF